jgi:hypothetical protein
MKMTLDQIIGELEDIAKGAGFPNDLYFIRKNPGSVSIEFDAKEAVDYFKGDYDMSSLSDNTYWEYRKNGKRHCAYIYPV